RSTVWRTSKLATLPPSRKCVPVFGPSAPLEVLADAEPDARVQPDRLPASKPGLTKGMPIVAGAEGVGARTRSRTAEGGERGVSGGGIGTLLRWSPRSGRHSGL